MSNLPDGYLDDVLIQTKFYLKELLPNGVENKKLIRLLMLSFIKGYVGCTCNVLSLHYIQLSISNRKSKVLYNITNNIIELKKLLRDLEDTSKYNLDFFYENKWW